MSLTNLANLYVPCMGLDLALKKSRNTKLKFLKWRWQVADHVAAEQETSRKYARNVLPNNCWIVTLCCVLQ